MSRDRIEVSDDTRMLVEAVTELESVVDHGLAGLVDAATAATREQTAATILAALVSRGDIESTTEGMCINEAVRLADALRAELAKGTP